MLRFLRAGSSLAAGAVAVVALASLTTGCTPAKAAGTLEKTSILVEDNPSIDSAGLYVAQMDGLFKQQGLNVTIAPTSAPQLGVDSQLAGTADISDADYVTYVQNELQNKKLRIIAEASTLQPNDLSLLTTPGSQITTLAGLKGRTVAVNTLNDMSTLLVRAVLAQDGIQPGNVNIQQGHPLQRVAQDLSEGQVSAAPVAEPFASEGQQAYGLRQLADMDQGSTKNFPLQGYAVTQDWAAKNPNTLAAFVRALEQGQQIADTDRGEAEAALVKFLNISPQTAAVIGLPNYPLSVNPVQLQRVPDTMAQFGLLSGKAMSFKITTMTGG